MDTAQPLELSSGVAAQPLAVTVATVPSAVIRAVARVAPDVRAQETLRSQETPATLRNQPGIEPPTKQELREWHVTYEEEKEDAAWTASVQQELDEMAAALLQGDLGIDELSCHETVCRAFIKFDDDVDAKPFREGPHDPELRFGLRSFDRSYTGEGFDKSDYSYELTIKRTRGEGSAEIASRIQ